MLSVVEDQVVAEKWESIVSKERQRVDTGSKPEKLKHVQPLHNGVISPEKPENVDVAGNPQRA